MQTVPERPPRSLSDLDVAGLAAVLAHDGMNPLHAKPILRLHYATHGRPDFTSLDLGAKWLGYLVDRWSARPSRVLHRSVASDGTTKLLVGFTAGGAAECVLMPGVKGDVAAGCVSSQIGCAMGCDFCASTKNGLERSLSAGEIVEQFLHLRAAAAAVGRRVKTIVFMGMGEPMLNLDQVLPAIGRIAGQGLGELGARHVTVSTVGIVPGIDRLTASDPGVHLALSLHAPDDETRTRIVPGNKRYPVTDVMAAAGRFHAATGRTPTIEYCLLAGVNDHDRQADLLADLVSTHGGRVNLIPYNPIGSGVSGTVYRKPTSEAVARFLTILRDRGVDAHVRRTRGDDVNAACGQLRETMVGLTVL
jgi:23S rRNA (adenine2503-C2)-methyltransferase